jgi:exonuclease VII small subunit
MTRKKKDAEEMEPPAQDEGAEKPIEEQEPEPPPEMSAQGQDDVRANLATLESCVQSLERRKALQGEAAVKKLLSDLRDKLQERRGRLEGRAKKSEEHDLVIEIRLLDSICMTYDDPNIETDLKIARKTVQDYRRKYKKYVTSPEFPGMEENGEKKAKRSHK